MEAKTTLEEKLYSFLTTLPFADGELQSAEDFLAGRAGHEVLDNFTFKDLAKTPADPSIRLFRELVKEGERGIAARLFSVLLAKGDATCYRMIPMGVIDPEKGAADVEVDAAKKAATYAAILGADLYPLDSYSRDRLVDIACGKAEILRQAIQFGQNMSENGRLILYAVYFMRKYKCGDKQEKRVKEEDFSLLAQYEEIAIESLERIYPPFHLSVSEIKDAVRKGAVTEHILKLAGLKHGIAMQRLKLVASLAYLNYPLSGRLKDVVKICLMAGMEDALDAINLIGLASPMDLYTRGGDYDQEFGLPTKAYIHWSAKRGHTLILEKQLNDHQETYIEVMDGAEIEASNRMLAVVKKKKPALYKELSEVKKYYGQNKLIDKLLNKLVRNNPDADLIRAYLRGNTSVDTLYPFVKKLGKIYYYNGGMERGILNDTDKRILDGSFYRRIQTYMWLRHGFWFLRFDLSNDQESFISKVNAAKVVDLFQNFDCEGLDIAHQLSGIDLMEESFYSSDAQIFHSTIIQIFGQYLKERRKETLAAFAGGDAAGRLLGLEILAQNLEENKEELLLYVEDGSKKVKQFLLEMLSKRTDWKEEMEGMLASKKSAVRELAIRVLAAWQESGMDCQEVLEKALKKEKSAKLKELLSDVLSVKDGGTSAGRSLTQKDLVKEIHKGGRKRSLSWAYATPFSVVHTVAGKEAGEEYLQAILLCYSAMTDSGYNANAQFLAKALREDEFAVYVNELFDKWLEAGAEAKKRWVLYAAAIHGGNEIIERLKRQIKEWPKQSRGMIACEAVQALSLNPLPQALLTVDGLARKFKYRQVRTAAGNALDFAAKQLGISREELIDRTVPDLGFDEGMGRTFDYGERKFRVMITPALEIEVFEELESKEPVKKHILGKKLKTLPVPGKKDDGKCAPAAYEEFKQMKKQMKEVVASQKLRLELALSTARLWNVDAWERLFVKNPVMHQFATGLIWGVYENGKLVQSFRYMEDGSFNTQDEEEYMLLAKDCDKDGAITELSGDGSVGDGKEAVAPEGKSTGKIGLVHPIELSEEDREVWKQQLADYEITQPFLQLERPFYIPEDTELEQREFLRFSGRVVNDISLGSRLTGEGWYHGMVIDGGCVKEYYNENKEVGFGAELNFSGCFVGYTNDNVTIYGVRFYRLDETKPGCLLYENDNKKECLLKDVPLKYFSEIVLQVEKATVQTT
ncbi:MAG: DUF4132 domain-containing protein [Lachnospiraceae bacterium]|nr:DUF4132 domain-containing protein [Lachnospiraceae bacterium]